MLVKIGTLCLALVALLPRGLHAQQVMLGLPETTVPPPDQPIDLSYSDRAYCVDDYPDAYHAPWTCQLLPDGLIYRNYLAGPRETHLSSIYNWSLQGGNQQFWDPTIGAHIGLIRYGTQEGPRPGGWQFDVEGAAYPRLDTDRDLDLRSVDFRGGAPLTYAYGPFEAKLGYYHTSSHLGDEFLLTHPNYPRINYVRDEIILGMAWRIRPSIRLYGEAGYAFHRDGGAEPWQFQFGAECSQLEPTGFRGSPFFAVNGHIREEVNWGGSLTAQAGWQWRGAGPGRLVRLGVNYFNGFTEQYSFLDQFEQLLGAGLWYDY